MAKIKSTAIDEYIATFPDSTQKILEKLRSVISKAAPEAEETINYGIPTFALKGNLVHFAAYKNHIGFYPAPSGIVAFKKELSVYDGAKGSIKFPIDQPLPFDLVTKIVKFRVTENLMKAETKKILRTCSKGHQYYKSSDCPTCPVCEKDQKPTTGFLSTISAPAKRALEAKGITTLKQLKKFSELEILALHGIGPGSIPKIQAALKEAGLAFKS
ncbi:hypothetical protein BH11BAC3_BH11BAC3_24910 [soil metagenome]